MKINRLSVLACAVAGLTSMASSSHAQTIVGLTGALSPENWTFTTDFSPTDFDGYTPGSQSGENPLDGPSSSYIEFCNCTDLIISGPITGEPSLGPITLSASVEIPFTASMRFDFDTGVYDSRGWGDGVDTFNRVGYTITRGGGEIDNTSLSDAIGADYNTTPGFFGLPGPRYAIDLEAGDILTFYVFSSTGSDYSAFFEAKNFILSSVPEPGEWMAMAGVGLIGFAGVRRWRQAKATV